jgi:hypothetical protein
MNVKRGQIANSQSKQLSGGLISRPACRLLGVAFAVGILFLAAPGANAQLNNGREGQQNPNMTGPGSGGANSTFQDRRIRELNVERQREMVSDTEKLLKLTAELSTEVAQNHSSALTPDQLRTLAKIEKLAKSVKEKMSNPVQGTIFQDGFPPPMSQPTIP